LTLLKPKTAGGDAKPPADFSQALPLVGGSFWSESQSPKAFALKA